MNLYLIKPVDGYKSLPDNPWEAVYDLHWGFVVAADNSLTARRLAADKSGARNPVRKAWMSPKYSSCSLLGTAAIGVEEGVVLEDYFAG